MLVGLLTAGCRQPRRGSSSASALDPMGTSASVASILRCREPWDCTLTEDLRGQTVDDLTKRFGPPNWRGTDEMSFASGSSCLGESQHLRILTRDGRVTNASFRFSGPDARCAEAAHFRPRRDPFEGLPCFYEDEGCPALKTLVGRTERRIIAGLGFPMVIEGGVWTYWFPEGCSFEVGVTTLTVRDGRVASADFAHEVTGEECVEVE
jgi:hypothetical protein